MTSLQFLTMNCFNPRTHVGCDTLMDLFKILYLSFNPRTHVGCDMSLVRLPEKELVSIHAPT